MRSFECFTQDLSNPLRKSKLDYRHIHFFKQGSPYTFEDYQEIDSLEIGESCNKSYGNFEHWIRRIS
jgi:hypothetical protein